MATPESSQQAPDYRAFGHHVWPAQPCCLAAIREEMRRFLAPLALTEDARQDLVLAVSEAATNCVEHAYVPGAALDTARDTVELTSWTEDHSVCVEITDHGHWRTPARCPLGHGPGIPVMQRLVEAVLIHYDPRGTRVLLIHPLPGGARPLPGGSHSPTSLVVPRPRASSSEEHRQNATA